MTEGRTPHQDAPTDGPTSLRVGVPADPRFRDLVVTAGRILAGSVPGGERLQDLVSTDLDQAIAEALADAGGGVQIDFSFETPELSVSIEAGETRLELRWTVDEE
jgi:hypothetical protein